MIYLALYKGHRSGKGLKVWKSRLGDWLTRKLTRGIYSHCEIAIDNSDGTYDCYSSSIRDGGVRSKKMTLTLEKWDLIPLKISDESHCELAVFYIENMGKKYDLFGAMGIVMPFFRHNRKRYFCSEFVWEALGGHDGWRFSPNDLAVIFSHGEINGIGK